MQAEITSYFWYLFLTFIFWHLALKLQKVHISTQLKLKSAWYRTFFNHMLTISAPWVCVSCLVTHYYSWSAYFRWIKKEGIIQSAVDVLSWWVGSVGKFWKKKLFFFINYYDFYIKINRYSIQENIKHLYLLQSDLE